MATPSVTLYRTSNQARELGQFAIDFMAGKFPLPDEIVFERLNLFHLDSVCCAASALAASAPGAPPVGASSAARAPEGTSRQLGPSRTLGNLMIVMLMMIVEIKSGKGRK